MGQLRDVALRSAEPLELARVLERSFGLTRVRWDEERSYAILTDGYMHISLSKAEDGESDSLDHLGFYVDDLEATCAQLTETCGPEARRSTPSTRFHPSVDRWEFEIRSFGWGWTDVIQAATQLYELTPVPPRPVAAVRRIDLDYASGRPVRVGTVDEIGEGDAVRVEIGELAVLVVNVDGLYYAVHDACPHLPHFGRLSEGRREGTIVECPVHASRFDLTTGEVLCPPATKGVSSVEVSVSDGEVWIAAPA